MRVRSTLPILLALFAACQPGGDRSSAGGFSAELGIDTAAMTKTPTGLQIQDVKVGQGAEAKPELAPDSEYAALTEEQRKELAGRLGELAVKVGAKRPVGSSEEALREAVVELDRAIDRKAAKKPARDPGPLAEFGPPLRRLQALLWKHGGKEYNDRRLNGKELVERLEARLAAEGVIQEGGRE